MLPGLQSRRTILCCLVLLSQSALARADTDARLDVLFGSHQGYSEFLGRLKDNVSAKDWPAVADLVAYPIRVNIAGHRKLLRSREEFLNRVRLVMSAKVIDAIQHQRYDALFANGNGVMIGDGEVWFSGICMQSRCIDRALKITAVNP